MIKILLVNVSLSRRKFARGGASKSFSNIFHGFAQIPNFKLYNLDIKVSKKTKQIFDRIPIGYYIFIPKIIHSIKKFKPDLIITQTRISFATIISAKITKTPILNIVRDPSDFCPKFIDIIAYGKNCPGLKNIKTCYKCINRWDELRIKIGNKPIEWLGSINSYTSKLMYKFRYIFCRINLFLLNLANLNLVASNLMKDFLVEYVAPEKIKKTLITPVKNIHLEENIRKDKKLLFIRTNYDASHKGLDLIRELSSRLLEGYKIIIAGSRHKSKTESKNIINIGYLNKNELNRVYQSSLITLIPSFYTEAFGRVAVESIINGTPVIASPNCGVNEYLRGKPYFYILPISLKKWKEKIVKIIKEPPKISLDERKRILKDFSIRRSIKDLLGIIKLIINNPSNKFNDKIKKRI